MFTKKRNHKLISILFILAILLSNVQTPVASAQTGDGLKRQVNAESGRVSFIGPNTGRVVPAAKALGTFFRPQDPAMALANRFAPEFGIQNPARELSEIKANRPADGRVIVRYQQAYQGIPVLGGELIVNTNNNGDLYSMSGEVSPDLALPTQPKIDSTQAAETALQALAKWYGKTPADFVASTPELWIFDESLLQPSNRPVELVWRMEVTPRALGMAVRELVLVNAERGNISLHFNQIDNAWGGSSNTTNLQSTELASSTITSKMSNLGSSNSTIQATGNFLPNLLGDIWYVATTGNNSNDCLTISTPCATINGAISKAASGNTIKVASGVYYSASSTAVLISKDISLSGGWNADFSAQNGYSVIDGPSTYGIYMIGFITASIENFIVKNSGDGITVYDFSTLTLRNSSLLSNNLGIQNQGTLIISNVTTSQNQTYGIANHRTLSILNSTISNNAAGGIYSGSYVYASTTIQNSILATNGSVSDPNNCDISAGTIVSSGYNIVDSISGCSITTHATDLVGTDPLLSPLLNVGFHALLGSSPAINAINPTACPPTDQRGVARPQGAGCDIGAFEYRGNGVTPTYLVIYAGTPQYVLKGGTASSNLKAVVLDENGDSVSGITVTFTAPAGGASAVFTSTGTNISTVVTDANGVATSSGFSVNNKPGSYIIQATVSGLAGSADFQIANGAQVKTYTANNTTNLPGTLLCDQTIPNCTNSTNPHADAAHKYAIGTHNFYATQFNRDSIDNHGVAIISTVHYDANYKNAFWSGTQMVYGDGAGFPLADDIVAHELTHGVTESESNLFYYYQSGAINESFSDVWGEYYDQTNGLGNDTPAVKWLHGEDNSGLGANRSMSNPPDFGDPDRMTSPYYYTSDGDSGGVHYNSGINNKAVYLMVEGGAFNGKTVTALGWEKIGAIYYEVNTNLLASASDYSDLYYAVQEACKDLTGQFGITAGDCQQVKNALDAVEMNAQPVVNFNPDAPVCAPGQATVPLFQDNFENGVGNWSIGGSAHWLLENYYASSPTHMMWGDDSVGSSDSTLALKNGVYLAPGSTPYLHFRHAFSFEYTPPATYYDGGVLEYSVNNGATWLDAAPLYSAGQNYIGTIDNTTGTSNALKGRLAFVGDSHGYVSSRYNLAALVGQTVKFRWRFATDQYFGYLGWAVDDVKIYTCGVDAVTPTVTSIAHSAASSPNLVKTDFVVTFSESVTGVSTYDFALTTTGVNGASIVGVSGTGSTRIVTVNTGTGNGTIRLDIADNDTITDSAGNPLGGLGIGNGNYTSGEIYTIVKDVETFIGGSLIGAYTLGTGERTSPRYGLNGGPVQVVSTNGKPILTSQRAIYGSSFNSIVGVPANQLTNEYWFTSLDDLGMITYLVIGNPSTTLTAHVDVYIAGVKKNSTPYLIAPGQRVYPRYGINGGPVHIVSDIPVFTSERTKYGNSFNEVLGYPANQLTTEYWFTSLDDLGMITYLVIGNPSTVDTALVDVYIAGNKMNPTPYSIAPGQRVFPRYGINGGPVQVVSTNGVPIFTSERTKYGNSFNEVLGYPGNKLATEYWFTSLDDASMITYLVIGNPSTTLTAHVDVYINGVKQNVTPYAIAPGQRVFPRYGVNSGAVRVVSDIPIFTSERSKYQSSFNEILGLPTNQLTTDYWFTSLDDLGMTTELVIAAP